ncbi:MAG: NYN domain-containing protein [Candidatus Hodarchaeales archaeon]|jgi:hypothetical protein
MIIPKVSTELKLRLQKLGTIFAPPITAGICLLAGLGLFYVALLTIVVAFPASLYNRRLYVYSEAAVATSKQDLGVDLLENQPNVVVYNTRDGLQIIGFYKISKRPQRQFLQTLNSTISNSNLAISLIDNANGTFLVIRFPGKGYRNQRQFMHDAKEHLQTNTQAITQDIPGLELEPATLEELKSLTGLLGLEITKKRNYDGLEALDTSESHSDREQRRFPSVQEIQGTSLRNAISQQARELDLESEKSSLEALNASEESVRPTNREVPANVKASTSYLDADSQFESLGSKTERASETGKSFNADLLRGNASNREKGLSHINSEIQAADAKSSLLKDGKSLLRPPQPSGASNQPRKQTKKTTNPKGLTLEQYIGESVRESRFSSSKDDPSNQFTMDDSSSIIKPEDSPQEEEEKLLRGSVESESSDPRHFDAEKTKAISEKPIEKGAIQDLGTNQGRKVAVVDGNNVAWLIQKNNKPQLENILLVKKALLEQGFEVIIWTSAKLRHDIDRPEEFEEMARNNEIIQAPAGTYDDELILKTAERLQGYVISNDQFKDFPNETWLKNRRLTYSIVGTEVLLVKPSQAKKKKTSKKRKKSQVEKLKPQHSFDQKQFAKYNAKTVAKLQELHRKITQTVEGLIGEENDTILTHTGKRVAGRLVVKDFIEILEAAEDLKEGSTAIKEIISELRHYIVENLGMSVETKVDPDEMWKHIPGGLQIVNRLLKKLNELLPAHQKPHYKQEQHPKKGRTAQPA